MANVEVKNLSYTPVSISTGSKRGSVALGARSCKKIDEKMLESAEFRRLLAERKLAVLQPRKTEEEKEPDKPRSNRSRRSEKGKEEAKDS